MFLKSIINTLSMILSTISSYRYSPPTASIYHVGSTYIIRSFSDDVCLSTAAVQSHSMEEAITVEDGVVIFRFFAS